MKATLAVLMLCISSSLAYKILCIFPAPTKSHDHLAKGIVQALLKAGHEITWATPYEQKDNANLTIIDLPATREIFKSVDMMNSGNSISFIRNFARNVSRTSAENPELRMVLVEQQFDAVISTWFINDFEAGYAAIQQVPWILLSSVGVHPNLEALVDEVRSINTVPLNFNDCPIPMSAGRRMLNGLFYLLMTVDSWFDEPRQAAIYEEIYAPLAAERGVPLPPFHEAQHNVSILLANSHESIGPALSLPPNVINIAGYHIDDKPAPLPKDLQDLLDSSPQGVVYFSMGSVLKSAELKSHTRAALLQLFSSLPYTVLWKFEEPLTGLPPNVQVRPWLPQPSVLAHKNIKVFITHGGLLSTLEAIHAGVPLLAVPVFGDQPGNAERARRAGYALRVDFHPDVAEELGVALKEMLSNDRYDLQDLLDSSPQGVVYFSMGSVLKSAELKSHTRAALLQLFSSLPYTVLWKFEEPLTGLPPNVHVRPWLPQPSVLAHKNIKVFITHGGLLSTLEAIHAGVPLLAVPVFGDQPGNAERARRAGYALRVDFHPDVAEELGVALKEMLSNDSYYNKAQYLSKIFRTRPAPPSELIAFYVKLAIESKGAYHLRSLSLKYSWYERWMLDLVLAFIAVFAVLIALLQYAVKACVRIISRRSKKENVMKKRN